MRIAAILLLSTTLSITAKAQLQTGVIDKVIAVVGDKIILRSEIQNTLADAERMGKPLNGDAECELIEQVMISKILMVRAEKDSLPVTDE